MLKDKAVILGVTACGNAWQTPALAQELVARGAQVEVILTPAAAHLVTELSLRNICKNPVLLDSFAEPKAWNRGQKPLAQRADLLLIAPASANLIAKAAQGIADDLLTTTLLSVTCPVLLVPQMSAEMTAKPPTQRNLARVVADGLHVMGEAAARKKGLFPFPEVARIADLAESLLEE